jgi:WD40 repeat protein
MRPAANEDLGALGNPRAPARRLLILAAVSVFAVTAFAQTPVAFSPDGRWLASGSRGMLWEVATGRAVGNFGSPTPPVFSVAFSPDGRWLASGSAGNTIFLWGVAGVAEIQVLNGHEDSVFSVAFSPDGRWLASGSADKTTLWEVATGREVRTF